MLMTPSINCSGGQILYRVCKYYFHIGVIIKIFSSQNNKLNLLSETKDSSEFNSFLAYTLFLKINIYLGCSGLFGVPADPLSFPYLTFLRHFCKA